MPDDTLEDTAEAVADAVADVGEGLGRAVGAAVAGVPGTPRHEMPRSEWVDLLSGVKKLVPALAKGDPVATQAAVAVLDAGMGANTFGLTVDGTKVAEFLIIG